MEGVLSMISQVAGLSYDRGPLGSDGSCPGGLPVFLGLDDSHELAGVRNEWHPYVKYRAVCVCGFETDAYMTEKAAVDKFKFHLGAPWWPWDIGGVTRDNEKRH